MDFQAPKNKPTADSDEPMVKKGIMGSKDKTKGDKMSELARHFEYISTMASFEDSFFKNTARKDLLKDRHETWAAFKTLSPQLVRYLAIFPSYTNLNPDTLAKCFCS